MKLLRIKEINWKAHAKESSSFLARILVISCLLVSCSEVEPPNRTTGNQNEDTVSDHTPDTLAGPPEGFALGGDISLLKKIQEYGGTYSMDGEQTDPLNIFKVHGWNYARLRLFHTPDQEGAVVNDLEYTLDLAGRIKEAGMKLMLDFHYSDTWADPGRQRKPAAWENIPFEILKDSVYQYTKSVLNAFAREGIIPDIVQPGNEINYGMLWPEGKLDGETEAEKNEKWNQFTELLKAGIKGIHDASGGDTIKVLLHIANGGEQGVTQWFFDNIEERNVDYDLIGQSYYPWWHGTFDDLRNNLQFMTQNYDKDIMIVETAYFWTGDYPQDGDYSDQQPFPCTVQGQYDFLHQLYNIALNYDRVKGLLYWYPESIEVAGSANLRYFRRSLFRQNGAVLNGMDAFQKEE